jgi:hypothetical protein
MNNDFEREFFIKSKLVCTRATKAKREWIVLRLGIGKDKRGFYHFAKMGRLSKIQKIFEKIDTSLNFWKFQSHIT